MMISMEEKKPIRPNGEAKDEELDQVAGGAPFFADPHSTCPNCGQWNVPVWSSERNSYICPNPACGVCRARSTGVQVVI